MNENQSDKYEYLKKEVERLHFNEKDYKGALKANQKLYSLITKDKILNIDDLFFVYMSFANAYIRLGDRKKGIYYIKKVMRYSLNTIQKIKANWMLSRYYKDINKDKAVQYCDYCLNQISILHTDEREIDDSVLNYKASIIKNKALLLQNDLLIQQSIKTYKTLLQHGFYDYNECVKRVDSVYSDIVEELLENNNINKYYRIDSYIKKITNINLQTNLRNKVETQKQIATL
jgi:hypothetical protein